MTQTPKTKERESERTRSSKKSEEKHSRRILNRYEFHRHAFALMPDPGDRRPGIAIFVQGNKESPPQRFCTCALSKNRTCSHILQLKEVIRVLRKTIGDKDPEEDFRSSLWHRLAVLLAESSGPPLEAVRFSRGDSDNGDTLRAYDSEENELVSYFSQGPDGSRFLERCVIRSDETQVPQRGGALEMLSRLTLA